LTLNRQTSRHTRGPTRPLTTQASAAPADFRVSRERRFTGPAAAQPGPRIRDRLGTIDRAAGRIALPFQHKQRGRGMLAHRLRQLGIRPAAPDVTSWTAQQLVQGPVRLVQLKAAYLLLLCWCKTGYHHTEGRRKAV